MITLVYKRTHCGDPDPETGVFGCNDCMGRIRAWYFDAVIGIGGKGDEPKRNQIARKLTWIGIGPHKDGDPLLVTFDHFLYCGADGPLLEIKAPKLATRMYDNNARFIKDSFSAEEYSEVCKILRIAEHAPSSPIHLRDMPLETPRTTKGVCQR
ncbi:MAG: hypothetical protein ACRES9_05995 [Gammaproteobacteria bacterium]